MSSLPYTPISELSKNKPTAEILHAYPFSQDNIFVKLEAKGFIYYWFKKTKN